MEYQQIRKAIQSLPVPTNITEVRGFLGMINQLSKFSPNLAERSKPIFIINKESMALGTKPRQSI